MYGYKDKIARWIGTSRVDASVKYEVVANGTRLGLAVRVPEMDGKAAERQHYLWASVAGFAALASRDVFGSWMPDNISSGLRRATYWPGEVVFEAWDGDLKFRMPLEDFLDMVQDYIGPAEPVQEKMRPSACKPVCATCDGAGSIKAMGWLHARCPDCAPPANLPGEVAERILRA